MRTPRVDDRRRDDQGNWLRFVSEIVPPYLRRTKSVEELIPWLYLKGISTGDFTEALAALLGPDAPGLSANTVVRLIRDRYHVPLSPNPYRRSHFLKTAMSADPVMSNLIDAVAHYTNDLKVTEGFSPEGDDYARHLRETFSVDEFVERLKKIDLQDGTTAFDLLSKGLSKGDPPPFSLGVQLTSTGGNTAKDALSDDSRGPVLKDWLDKVPKEMRALYPDHFTGLTDDELLDLVTRFHMPEFMNRLWSGRTLRRVILSAVN